MGTNSDIDDQLMRQVVRLGFTENHSMASRLARRCL
jgi:hypothetical protein